MIQAVPSTLQRRASWTSASRVDPTVNLPPIRLIPFQSFKELRRIPRYPEDRELTVIVDHLPRAEYENSLIIFISHSWLRGRDEKPHPDNERGGKYNLCVLGIERILAEMTTGEGMGCFIWLDYGCIDQNGDPAGELRDLDRIVEICDLIFTPIVDDDWATREWPERIVDWYKDYVSPVWTGTPHSYVNRGWCRIEMFYAANIPLLEDSASRRKRLKNGLAFHHQAGRRPHLLYGSREVARSRPPFILPPLQNSYFNRYHPEEGVLSIETDRQKIKELVQDLLPYMQRVQVGYFGAMKDGKEDGDGKYVYEDGNIYEGQFREGFKHGRGKFLSASGNTYEGEYVNDKKEGKGIYRFANGEVYDGEYFQHLRHGVGTFYFTDGSRYEGEWKNDKKEGKGRFFFGNGDIYDGEFHHGNRHGTGRICFKDGSYFEGKFEDNLPHGWGQLTSSSGEIKYQRFDRGKIVEESLNNFHDG